MNISRIRQLLCVGTITLLVPTAVLPQTPRPAAASPQAPSAASSFQPGLDDLMTMLIQPRHIKLYYAGTQANWESAASEAHDLRQAFVRISQFIPNYLGNDVNAALAAIMLPKLQAVDDAIAAAKPDQFAHAYDQLTSACNACHAYLEHPYHVIRRPAPASDALYTDQDFSPKP